MRALHVCAHGPPTAGFFINSQSEFQGLVGDFKFPSMQSYLLFSWMFTQSETICALQIVFLHPGTDNEMPTESLLLWQTLSFTHSPPSSACYWVPVFFFFFLTLPQFLFLSVSLLGLAGSSANWLSVFCVCVYRRSIANIACRYCESPGDGTVWQHSADAVFRLPGIKVMHQMRLLRLWAKMFPFISTLLKGFYLCHFCLYQTEETRGEHVGGAGGAPVPSQYPTREMVITC